MQFVKRLGSSIKRASRVDYKFKSQVVQAIHVSYQLAGKAKDPTELCKTYVRVIRAESFFTLSSSLDALDNVIEAAVNVKNKKQPKETIMDKLNEFLSCLKDEPMLKE